MSSPTFLGDKPKGPILGANAEADPISPPVVRKITSKSREIESSMIDGHEVIIKTPQKGKGYEVDMKKQ